MVRSTIPPHARTFLAKCSEISRRLRNFKELRRSVYTEKKRARAGGENGRAVGWCGSVILYLLLQTAALFANKESGKGIKESTVKY